MTNEEKKNAVLSAMILIKRSEGMTVQEAIDFVLGEGTYKRIAGEVYDILRNSK